MVAMCCGQGILFNWSRWDLRCFSKLLVVASLYWGRRSEWGLSWRCRCSFSRCCCCRRYHPQLLFVRWWYVFDENGKLRGGSVVSRKGIEKKLDWWNNYTRKWIIFSRIKIGTSKESFRDSLILCFRSFDWEEDARDAKRARETHAVARSSARKGNFDQSRKILKYFHHSMEICMYIQVMKENSNKIKSSSAFNVF